MYWPVFHGDALGVWVSDVGAYCLVLAYAEEYTSWIDSESGIIPLYYHIMHRYTSIRSQEALVVFYLEHILIEPENIVIPLYYPTYIGTGAVPLVPLRRRETTHFWYPNSEEILGFYACDEPLCPVYVTSICVVLLLKLWRDSGFLYDEPPCMSYPSDYHLSVLLWHFDPKALSKN